MLAAKFGAIFPHLDERQRRLLMGAEARALGHGGIRLVALAAQAREGTVSLGVLELESGAGHAEVHPQRPDVPHGARQGDPPRAGQRPCHAKRGRADFRAHRAA